MTANRTQFLLTYDYVVIGGGSAGAIVSCRLAQHYPHRVLLLEAGGAQNSLMTDLPGMAYHTLSEGGERFWHYSNVPQVDYGMAYKDQLIPEPKGKVLGGQSATNLMAYIRANRRDFDIIYERFGSKGWSYDEVLPYFKKSENNSDPNVSSKYHGRSGPIGVSTPQMPDPILRLFLKANNEIGFPTIDLNGVSQLGSMITQSTIKEGLRSSTANEFIEFSDLCKSLQILTKAFVTKILIGNNKNGKPYAYGVEFLKDNTIYRVIANKEVILSAGAINSPKILMLSGIGPKDHLRRIGISTLWADLPVGDHYSIHPGVVNNVIIRHESLVNPRPALELQQLFDANVKGTGVLAQLPIFTGYESTSVNPDKEWPDVLINAMAAPKHSPSFITGLEFGERVEEWEEYIQNLTSNDYLIIFPTLMRPKSTGTIRLNSTDPMDPPLINPNILSHPSDRQALLEVLRLSFFIVEKTSFAQFAYVNPNPIPGCGYCANGPVYSCESYLRCLIVKTGVVSHHPLGSNRMGSIGRPDVVVDDRLRVKGVGGLRVVDNSVWPQTLNCHTNSLAMLVGEKGAGFIIEDDYTRDSQI